MKPDVFAERVGEAMARRGLTLRALCRAAELDPSFLSKVLAGKRSPPWDEAVLRRLAQILELDPLELIVAAGRLPSEWRVLLGNPRLFDQARGLLGGPRRHAAEPAAFRSQEMGEELL